MSSKPIITQIPNNINYSFNGIKVGVGVPGWRQKMKEGRSASSPYYLDACKVTKGVPLSAVHTRAYKYGPGPNDEQVESFARTGYLIDLSSRSIGAFGGPTVEDEAAVLSKIYEKIRSETSSVNGLLVMSELRQTINMLRNPLSAAREATSKYLSALKSKQKEVSRKVTPRRSDSAKSLSIRRANALKNGMSGSWLELQFGILPAISDAKDILQEVASYAANPLYAMRTKVSATSAPRVSHFVDINSVNSYWYTTMCHDLSMTRKSISSIRYDVGLTKRVDAPFAQTFSIQERLGFEFQNFVPTIYELVPWSFLIDYFVNLGDIVSAATTDTSNVFYVTSTSNIDTTITVSESLRPYSEERFPGELGVWRTKSLSGASDSIRVIKHRRILRTVHDKLPMPQLIFSIPGIESKKWLNMSALLTQAKNFKF